MLIPRNAGWFCLQSWSWYIHKIYIYSINFLKEAEKANKNAELLISREEETKKEFQTQLATLKSNFEETQKKFSKQIETIEDGKGKNLREIENFKFEIEQKITDLEQRQQVAKENKNGMVNGMPSLEREIGKDYFTSIHSMRRVLFL